MAGLIITPRREDYEKLTAEEATRILREVSAPPSAAVTPAAPTPPSLPASQALTVGILSADSLDFLLNGAYQAKGETICGPQAVELAAGSLLWRGQQYRELCFTPVAAAERDDSTTQADGDRPEATFTLRDVTIGRQFHWERRLEQTFTGILRLMVDGGKILAINELPLEDYLESVISSEMSASSPVELLKAHAIISRSWVLYQKELRAREAAGAGGGQPFVRKDDELLRWYDRETHALFDVCADDHCQRYHGITPTGTQRTALKEALHATRGQVLTYGGQLCDTRFSKCCGGQTEEYRYCWDNTQKPYLQSVADPYCDTRDEEVLREVLRDYDQPTIPQFHDWTVEYTQQELSDIVERKTQLGLGLITDIVPLSRGKSGRIWRLRLVGTERTFTIGKELEIRRALSDTHLLSSAFDVEKAEAGTAGSKHNGTKFTLKGRGWGHGVGLCQIGAAVMAAKGFSCRQILQHYYPGAEITTLCNK